MNIAYFISPHGFGHAARSCAIMEQLQLAEPSAQFFIYTLVPEWFFKADGIKNYQYYPVRSDVGLVQPTALDTDYARSIEVIGDYLREMPEQSEKISRSLQENRVDISICDISPLGILSSKKAGVPSVLFENFTWDWMYEPYTEQHSAFKPIIEEFAFAFSESDYHCQMIPHCHDFPARDLLTSPVWREPRNSAQSIRERLGVLPTQKMGLVSMGGIPQDFSVEKIKSNCSENIKLIIPGNTSEEVHAEHFTLLPHHSDYYHPDLLFASDFIIGKAGYSTIAEIRGAGIPYGYILRPDFRETEKFASFLSGFSNMLEVSKDEFERMDLLNAIQRLSQLPKIEPEPRNGAKTAADFILQKLRKA